MVLGRPAVELTADVMRVHTYLLCLSDYHPVGSFRVRGYLRKAVLCAHHGMCVCVCVGVCCVCVCGCVCVGVGKYVCVCGVNMSVCM